ncbi:hypothetical protein WDW89_04150 [Deltaproteobacteria bacterium TL4]
MFDKSDVLDARFKYEGDVLIHNCVVRLEEGNEVREGTRFGITVNADARPGKELTMILSDISKIEQIKIRVEMITAEHVKKVPRGWYSIVEVKEILRLRDGDDI